MSRTPPPTCKDVRSWLQGRLGRRCLAPLTGTTSRVFSAYLHLLDAWMSSHDVGIEVALRQCVAVLQQSEHVLAVWAIPAIGDWGHVAELWPRIKPSGAPDYVGDSSVGEVYVVREMRFKTDEEDLNRSEVGDK